MPRTLLATVLLVYLGACAGSVPPPREDPDADHDGVPLPTDHCPNEPEDVDHVADEDGCPDPNDDGDALADVDDVCPNDAEDVDGFQDGDGCPDPDNDGDRIEDVADSCPCSPEIYNGYEDEDGCPDCGVVLLIDTRIHILEQIYFDRGRTTIGARNVPILDAIASVLRENPMIRRVQMVGHASADERGAEALGDARARAVMEQLVSRGVEPDRLSTVSYGAERPVDPGRSRHAYERNRRVEFEILDPIEDPRPSGCASVPPVPGCTGR